MLLKIFFFSSIYLFPSFFLIFLVNSPTPCFFNIKNDVYKALEEARNEKVIGKSLEAKVLLNLLDEDKELLSPILPNLKQAQIKIKQTK